MVITRKKTRKKTRKTITKVLRKSMSSRLNDIIWMNSKVANPIPATRESPPSNFDSMTSLLDNSRMTRSPGTIKKNMMNR